MKEKLLLKCENTVFADEIAGLLLDKGIPVRLHDESMDTVVGAYGAITGIAVFVAASDYDRALALVQPIVDERNHFAPMCPKCGGEHVEPISRKRNHDVAITLALLLMLLLPVVYFAWPTGLGHRSEVGDIIALVMIGIAFLFIFFGHRSNANYQCKDCGHRFQHFTSD